ncbi:hypothetical protein V6N13_042927 [Hibiscus sabdariffa]
MDVAPGETQVPRVNTHVMDNVIGNHSAISILDVANEKRRQNLVISSGKHNTPRNVGSSGMPMPADPGENDVRNDAVMMAHSAMVTSMVPDTSVAVEPASYDC